MMEVLIHEHCDQALERLLVRKDYSSCILTSNLKLSTSSLLLKNNLRKFNPPIKAYRGESWVRLFWRFIQVI